MLDDSGLVMVIEVFKYYGVKDMIFYFVFNIDGIYIVEVFVNFDFEMIFFFIVFKIFIIVEIIINVNMVKLWFFEKIGGKGDIVKYFVVFFINEFEVIKFGIDVVNMFGFESWVGGCYFVWSVIGFSVVFYVGFDNFYKFLVGVYVMDQYFQQVFFRENILVIGGFLSVWYFNFYGV